MAQYNFHFKTKITFSETICQHIFLLRCTPLNFESQKVLMVNHSIIPSGLVNVSTDSFGNIVHNGSVSAKHNYFEFISEGTVELGKYCIAEPLNRLYLYPSQFTQLMPNIEGLYKSIKIPVGAPKREKLFLFSTRLHQILHYEPGITTVDTTASEALSLGKGVCQDFAHLLIVLCRIEGIASRYVSGFMEGEGFTHAWVEFYDEGAWYGFDPTHNQMIDSGYIKIAHGRDYYDCSIERGVFKGQARQRMEVVVKVNKQ